MKALMKTAASCFLKMFRGDNELPADSKPQDFHGSDYEKYFINAVKDMIGIL